MKVSTKYSLVYTINATEGRNKFYKQGRQYRARKNNRKNNLGDVLKSSPGYFRPVYLEYIFHKQNTAT